MTEEKEIEEYKDLLSEKIISAFPEQPDPAQYIEELMEIEGIKDSLRISQIDIIDILSQPTVDASDIQELIKEYDLQPHEKRKRRNHKDIEGRLKPYGITNLLWKQYHEDHYDAFDLPLIPKRSLSIPINNGLSGAWAPNGYGKTFVFARILKILQETKALEFGERAMDTHELFTDFLRKCTAYLHHSNKSTIPLPYDGQREKGSGKRLIPFRQICFSVEALKDNHATEFFSIRIEIEYDATGNVSDYSLHLLAPNVAELVVVEGNIKLPNWINSNFHLEKISYTTLSSEDHYSKWPIIALQKLLSLNINYIEIPSLAYQPNAGDFVQENIKTIVNSLLDEFTNASYEDIEIDKYGLLATLSKEGGPRHLLDALRGLASTLDQDEDDKTPVLLSQGTGMNALKTLIHNIATIEFELNALVNNDNDAWSIKVLIRTPKGENSLDIIDSSSQTILPWKHLSFGQRNELIFQTTLAQYHHCYDVNNTEDQVVLVIDEPEAGRSESWVNQLMHKLSTHTSTHPTLILSHRGMVLESINPSREYQIMHTVKPDIDEAEGGLFKEYGTLQSQLSTKAKESFALINALVNRAERQARQGKHWVVNFPKTITPTEEWMEYEVIENQWILKPISITEDEIANIKQFINEVKGKYILSNQELLLQFWNGRTWIEEPNTFEHQTPKSQEEDLIPQDELSDIKVKGIHVGGLGLPSHAALIFVLTHLPTDSKRPEMKTVKSLADNRGVKLSNTRIENVRKIISKAPLPNVIIGDQFSQNLNLFVAGLKERHKYLKSQEKESDRNALLAYISELETLQTTDNQRISPGAKGTLERGFFDYLHILGVKTPPSGAPVRAKSPIIIKKRNVFGGTSNVSVKIPESKNEFEKTMQYLIKNKKHPTSASDLSDKSELRNRDKAKNPTQANFNNAKYRWAFNTLIGAIMEAEINDYAEELVLQLASRYADENDLDTAGKIWIRADSFKKAAREIADRDVSSRIYDDFDDKCGQYMLIRADIHGYSCLTCESMYDEKKNNI